MRGRPVLIFGGLTSPEGTLDDSHTLYVQMDSEGVHENGI